VIRGLGYINVIKRPQELKIPGPSTSK